MRVLAVDTTSPRGSIALADETRVLAEQRVVSETGHSGWLLPAVEECLRRVGWRAQQLDLFAVTSGPGSFTGLRVGIGTVQGLALASGRPCLGIPTLDVWAHEARGAAESIVVLLDAFRGEAFSAVYDRDGRVQGERSVGTPEAALARAPARSAFVGDLVASQRSAILAAVEGPAFPETTGFLAATLAGMAIGRAGEAGPAAALRPVYLRGAAIRPARA